MVKARLLVQGNCFWLRIVESSPIVGHKVFDSSILEFRRAQGCCGVARTGIVCDPASYRSSLAVRQAGVTVWESLRNHGISCAGSDDLGGSD